MPQHGLDAAPEQAGASCRRRHTRHPFSMRRVVCYQQLRQERATMSVADWRPYYDATEGRPPRPTLLRALAGFAAEGRGPGLLAADLGCGIGRDALVLLHAGWRVWAL